MISVNELGAGVVFNERGEYFLVLSYEHIKMGRGSGNIKVKVKNLSTGSTVEKSYITGARVQDASLERKRVQYLYQDSGGAHVMDMENFEQFVVDRKLVEDVIKFFKEGMELNLISAESKLLYVEISKILDYKVVQTGGSARGNTVGASYKDATLENGLTVKVPLFIKNGEIIRVDTRSGDYVERAK